jgi:hypothetical protein
MCCYQKLQSLKDEHIFFLPLSLCDGPLERHTMPLLSLFRRFPDKVSNGEVTVNNTFFFATIDKVFYYVASYA